MKAWRRYVRSAAPRSTEPDGTDEARACFAEARDFARSQSARSQELRATTSLGRLLAKEGRRDEAREMLADIYGWFTEGCETPT